MTFHSLFTVPTSFFEQFRQTGRACLMKCWTMIGGGAGGAVRDVTS